MTPLAAGYELTFTNDHLIRAGAVRGDLELDTAENLAACDALARALRASIPDHRHVVEDDGHGFPRHVIKYPDGYWIAVEIDPWVVEVTGQHLTIDGYRSIAPRMEQLFEIARRVGLEPHSRIGGGHIHIDRESLGSAPSATRNFIVDYFNHPELALGILGFDPLNAAPFASAPGAAVEAFVDSLAQFDKNTLDLTGLLHHLRTRVYTYANPTLPARADRSKYQSLSVNHPATIEIRAIRPQRCFAEFIALLRLFEARISFLARHREPIILQWESWPASAPMPRLLARARFQAYLAEIGIQRWSRRPTGSRYAAGAARPE